MQLVIRELLDLVAALRIVVVEGHLSTKRLDELHIVNSRLASDATEVLTSKLRGLQVVTMR